MDFDKSKVTITIMNLNDLNQISDCLQNEFDNFWTYDILKEELSSKHSTYLVAKIDSQIIGFAGFKNIFNEAELMNIIVHKSFRNCGIGNLLMKNILLELKAKKIATVHLEVAKNNISAIHLYQKFGFYEVGLRKNYYKDDDAILMELTIN